MVNILTHWNGFVQRKRAAPLSTGELALYYVLMEHWNGLGRPEWLSVAAGVLQADSGLSDTTFKRARQRLCRKGYINYQQGAGRREAPAGTDVMGGVACGRGRLAELRGAEQSEAGRALPDHRNGSVRPPEPGAAAPPSLALPKAKQASPHTVSATNGSGSRCDGLTPGERDRREAGAVGVG